MARAPRCKHMLQTTRKYSIGVGLPQNRAAPNCCGISPGDDCGQARRRKSLRSRRAAAGSPRRRRTAFALRHGELDQVTGAQAGAGQISDRWTNKSGSSVRIRKPNRLRWSNHFTRPRSRALAAAMSCSRGTGADEAIVRWLRRSFASSRLGAYLFFTRPQERYPASFAVERLVSWGFLRVRRCSRSAVLRYILGST